MKKQLIKEIQIYIWVNLWIYSLKLQLLTNRLRVPLGNIYIGCLLIVMCGHWHTNTLCRTFYICFNSCLTVWWIIWVLMCDNAQVCVIMNSSCVSTTMWSIPWLADYLLIDRVFIFSQAWLIFSSLFCLHNSVENI